MHDSVLYQMSAPHPPFPQKQEKEEKETLHYQYTFCLLFLSTISLELQLLDVLGITVGVMKHKDGIETSKIVN